MGKELDQERTRSHDKTLLTDLDNNIIENSETVTNLTPIQEFYAHQSIFITGGTGFLGKLLIEKLFRSCPELAFLYLLVRPKKGKDIHQRAEELFDDPVFSKLKEENPKFRQQIILIAGDCSLPNLGISTADKDLLIREVSIVFHVAATVRFDEKLKLAVFINVKSPKDVLNLCKEMPHLKSCIHVSTAYANCVEKKIEEKFYNPPMDSNKLITLVDSADDKLVDEITKPILGRWPNTYTFTKAVAEDVVRQEANEMPVGIFRPAIVMSTYQEPIQGWTDNMYGPMGVTAAVSTGMLRSLHCNGSFKANVVPGDMTVNALIASAWDVAELKKNNRNSNKIPIYNYVSVDNPITWDRFKDLFSKYHSPTSQAVWYFSFSNTSNKFVHQFYMYSLHLFPALLVDGILYCIGKQPKMFGIYKKIQKLANVLNYFTTNEWTFTNDNVNSLYRKLNSKDRRLFGINMKDVDWDTYYQNYMRGIRLYIFKDPIETLPQARTRWQRLYWLHQTFKVMLIYLFLKISWPIFLRPLWNKAFKIDYMQKLYLLLIKSNALLKIV